MCFVRMSVAQPVFVHHLCFTVSLRHLGQKSTPPPQKKKEKEKKKGKDGRSSRLTADVSTRSQRIHIKKNKKMDDPADQLLMFPQVGAVVILHLSLDCTVRSACTCMDRLSHKYPTATCRFYFCFTPVFRNGPAFVHLHAGYRRFHKDPPRQWANIHECCGARMTF